MPFPDAPPLAALTTAQMVEVDRLMVEEFGIDLVRMMENAGRNLAELALRRFQPRRVTVLTGSGGNGGGGLVAARHLANRGVSVVVTPSGPDEGLTEVPAAQLAVLRRMGVPVQETPDSSADLVIDALIGYSLRGDPRGRAGELIDWANRRPAPVLSLDLPSGLDATTGHIGRPCVRAAATLTLALPKTGTLRAPEVVGELYLADISVPPALYSTLGIELGPIFAESTILRVAREP